MKKLLKDLMVPFCLVFCLACLVIRSYNEPTAINTFVENNPEKVTLIIDAGHGGTDGGAVSISGKPESEINLAIAQKVDALASFFGVNTIMTRDTDTIDYPDSADTIRAKKIFDQKSRVELITRTPHAVLLSIHQNKYSDKSASGAQFFSNPDTLSVDFAAKTEAKMHEFFPNLKIRASKTISNDIYLFKNISCPAIMAECGFLSNPAEDLLLSDNFYRTEISVALLAGFLDYETTLNEHYFGGAYEN